MDFLPIKSNGEKVYAGFWKRLCAGLADAIIIIPLVFFFVWLQGLDRNLAIVISIPSSILFAMYNVYFNARFGGTPGKLAVGVRITKPDGSCIGWREAWQRSAVDLTFAFIILVVNIWVLTRVDPTRYASHGWMKRALYLQEHWPAGYKSFINLQQVWIWSEVIVLLFNKRKRAIHDFIAGTVVINKEFALQKDGQQSSENDLSEDLLFEPLSE
jgi:uncharacterized RDD family membrane protein YckC